MKCVIEFEGYNIKSRFVFKEIAIHNLKTRQLHHFFIKPPFSRCLLSKTDESVVRYCENHLHRIKWNSGSVHMASVFEFLKKLPSNTILYTKGLEKVRILHKLCKGFQIKNLEDYDCPKVDEIKSAVENECPLGFHLHKNTLSCATKKSELFASFLLYKHESSRNS